MCYICVLYMCYCQNYRMIASLLLWTLETHMTVKPDLRWRYWNERCELRWLLGV